MTPWSWRFRRSKACTPHLRVCRPARFRWTRQAWRRWPGSPSLSASVPSRSSVFALAITPSALSNTMVGAGAHMSGSRRFWLVILLVAGVLGGCAAPDAQPPSRSVEPEPAASKPAEPDPSAISGGPIDIRETSPEAVTPDPVTTPVRLDYPDRDITLEVDPVGVAQDGQMEIPEDADRAGWYRFGPGVGDGKGTVVIAAHNGSFTTGVGPFHYLRQARPGDVIELSGADGTVATYDVVSTASEAKAVIDLAAYFERDGRPRLVLITCGGQWQEDVGSYSDNIVVTANLRQG